MFFPGVSQQAVVEAAGLLAFWQALLPVVTNLAALPVLFYAARIRSYFILAAFSASFFFSWFYHQCLSWPVTCFDIPVESWRLNDHIWASSALLLMMIYVLRLYVFRPAPVFMLASVAFVTALVTTVASDLYVYLLVGTAMLLLLFVRVALLDAADEFMVDSTAGGTGGYAPFDSGKHVHWPPFLAGAVLAAGGIALFMVDDSAGSYWLLHSIWHIGIYLGGYFWLLGVTRDLEGWYDVVALLRLRTGTAASSTVNDTDDESAGDYEMVDEEAGLLPATGTTAAGAIFSAPHANSSRYTRPQSRPFRGTSPNRRGKAVPYPSNRRH